MKRLVFMSLLLAMPVGAQQGPAAASPKGPRDIISGAQKARVQKEMKQAASAANSDAPAAAPAAPTVPQAPQAPAVPGAQPDPHAGAGVGSPADAALSSNAPNPGLPAGSVRVRVVDAAGAPVVGADVVVGKLGADGSRERKAGKTGPDGTHTFSGLDIGERQAYRASVPYQGAKYASMPFRLPQSGGWDVTLKRLETTDSARRLVIYVGAVSVELKDDRLKVVQQMRLVNVGTETYVFPQGGTRIALPEGFMAFTAEEVMTDQRISAVQGEGMKVEGSIPPGQTTLMWGFDLPREGSEVSIPIKLPWAAFAFRVLADAAPGLSLSVDGMPPAKEEGDAGRRYLLTEMQRRIGDPALPELVIRLRGIPGPGPARLVAAGLALLLLLVGLLYLARRPGRPRGLSAERFEQRKGDLMRRVVELSALRQAEEIGPEFHAQELTALEEQLSVLLYERSLTGKTQKGPSSHGPSATGPAQGR